MRLLKHIGKTIVVAILSWQLRRLQAKYPLVTVGVVGSYGKTSTKSAIATVLSQHFRVRYQAGNYNDIVTVPLIFFGEQMPSLLNPLAWCRLFVRNERQLRQAYPYDVVVVELGTDGPGQLAAFGRYLSLDFTVLTAIAYEHMEFFADLQAVAEEELTVQQYSSQLLVNTDLCAKKYVSQLSTSHLYFGQEGDPEYKIAKLRTIDNAYTFELLHDGRQELRAMYPGLARTQVYSAAAAAIIGLQLSIPADKLAKGIAKVVPVSGRMRVLDGVNHSLILDETYNSSPAAAKAALDTLYAIAAPQKLALLGNMNELGDYAAEAHREVGRYCDPHQLDMVLTLGPEANAYLAPAAKAKGCRVQTFDTPYEAGAYLKAHLKIGAVALIKGSQNKVFAEEAVKLILQNPADVDQLIRQSPQWLKKKARSFNS